MRTRSLLFLVPSICITLAACDDKGDGDTDIVDTDTDTDPADTDSDDADGDGWSSDDDCDDLDADVYPGAEELCDGVDNDCDDEIDEDLQETYYEDADDDGFGDEDSTYDACEPPSGYVPNSGDCDDSDATIYDGAEELCDGIDNDCDDEIDEDLGAETYYEDADGDGFGDPDSSATDCEEPTGYVGNDSDCDDADPGEPVIVSQSGPISADTGWDTSGGLLDSGGMGTASDPFVTIQDGVDAAEVCVHVYPGSYTENVSFSGKDLVVWGVEGAGETSIDGGDAGSTVSFGGNDTSTLNGFTVTGGSGTAMSATETESVGTGSDTYTATTDSYYGGGIYVSGAEPTLEDLVVTGNSLAAYSYTVLEGGDTTEVVSFGGGLYVEDGAATTEGVEFSENSADAGGGAYVSADGTLVATHDVFDANTASSGGGFTSEGTVTAGNSVLVNNASSGTGSTWGGAGVDIGDGIAYLTNVTVVGNDSASSASVYNWSGGSLNIKNSILTANESGAVLDAEDAGVAMSYSDVYSTGTAYGSGVDEAEFDGVDGNIQDSPLFTSWSDDDDYSNDDLSLDAASTCVDAGDPDGAYDDADGTANDMGAYGGPDGTW